MATKKELINSTEFDKALNEGAEYKRDTVTTYKAQNKSNFKSFAEVMYEANEDIKRILDTKKKKRTESDVEKLNSYKADVRAMYGQVQSLCVDEHLEEGKKSKVEKLADKLVPVLKILRYIGNTALDDALKANGIQVTVSSIDNDIPGLADASKKTAISGILNSAIKLRQKAIDDDSYISEDIYQKKVPTELQYDKKSNNTGLKTGDWKKLVDMKTKLIMAKSEEAKEKVEDKIEAAASEKQFEVARAELVRDKLTKLQ